MRKHILSLAFFLSVFFYAYSSNPTIDLGLVYCAELNDTVVISLKGEYFDRINTFGIEFTFDSNVLQYIDVIDQIVDFVPTVVEESNSRTRVTLMWFGGMSYLDFYREKEICKFRFINKGGSSTLNFVERNCVYADNINESAYFQVGNATFNTRKYCSAFLPNLEVYPDEEVLVPVTVENLNSVGSLGFKIYYNSNVLEYLSIENIDSKMSSLIYNNSVDTICLAWLTMSSLNLGNRKLFDIRFKYNGGKTNLIFLKSSTISAYDLCDFVVTFNNGSVSSKLPIPEIFEQPLASVKCEKDNVSFSVVAGSSLPLSYQWKKNDINIQAATNSSVTINNLTTGNAGNYSCTVRNDQYSINSGYAFLTVNPQPLSKIITSDNLTFCQNGKAILKSSDVKSNYYYQWQKNDINILSATNSNFSADKSGLYSLKITDLNKCNNISEPVRVNVYPKPVLNLGNDTTIAGDKFIILDAGNGMLSYNWNNGLHSQLQKVDGSLLGQGTFNYSVTVSNEFNCVSSDDINVHITEGIVTLSLQSDTVSKGDTVIIPLTVRNFNNIVALGIKIYYDTLNLKFLMIKNINPNINELLANNYKNEFTMAWSSINNQLNLANCKLADLVYVATGGSSDLRFSTATELINSVTMEEFPLKLIDASIYVDLTYSIAGSVTYDNKLSSPLNGVKVKLYDYSDKLIDSVFTDNDGKYAFNNLLNNKYSVKASSTEFIPANVASPTDALFVNMAFVRLYTFPTELRKKAADVDAKNDVTPTDGLLINKKFVKLLDKFPTGNWLFESGTLNVKDNNVIFNIKGICVGDANASFTK